VLKNVEVAEPTPPPPEWRVFAVQYSRFQKYEIRSFDVGVLLALGKLTPKLTDAAQKGGRHFG
jgi:hypothetical protein